jgi:hypothetical protein
MGPKSGHIGPHIITTITGITIPGIPVTFIADMVYTILSVIHGSMIGAIIIIIITIHLVTIIGLMKVVAGHRILSLKRNVILPGKVTIRTKTGILLNLRLRTLIKKLWTGSRDLCLEIKLQMIM